MASRHAGKYITDFLENMHMQFGAQIGLMVCWKDEDDALVFVRCVYVSPGEYNYLQVHLREETGGREREGALTKGPEWSKAYQSWVGALEKIGQ